MTFRQHPSFRLWFPAVVALAATACAHKVTIERRANGILHIECESGLPQCLTAAEVACDRERYTVLRAYDQHDWAGGQPKPGTYNPYIEIRKSEAFVRCGFHGSYGPDMDVMRKLELCDEPEPTPPPKPFHQPNGLEPAPEPTPEPAAPPPVPPKEPDAAPAP